MYYKDGKRVDNCEECKESTQNEPKTNPIQLDYILTLIKNIHKDGVFKSFLKLNNDTAYKKLYAKCVNWVTSDSNPTGDYSVDIFGLLPSENEERIIIEPRININQFNSIFDNNKDLFIKLLNDELREYNYHLRSNTMDKYLCRSYR